LKAKKKKNAGLDAPAARRGETFRRSETPPTSETAPHREAAPRAETTLDLPAGDRARHLLAIFTLCALTLLAYSNSFGVGFALDNQGLILNDPRIRGATAENVALIFQHSYWWPIGEAGLYRPLTTLSYLFNYAILGDRDQPAGYHLINLLLHAGNVLLLYALALKLIRKFWPSVFIAALWAVHPASTESVTNIIGRSDILAGMATFGGLLVYLKSTEATRGRRVDWLLALAGLTAAGVYSKESAVTVAGVVVLYELTWWKERRQVRGLLLGCLAMLAPIALMLYQRSVVLSSSPPAEFPFTDNPIAGADFWTGRLTALAVIPRYLWLTIWPANLTADYSYPQIPLATGSAQDWIGWVVVLTAVAGIAWLYRSNRTAFFLATFAIVTFVPVSNLLFPIGAIMADRFLYLPSAGLLGCLVLAVYAAAGRLKAKQYAPEDLARTTEPRSGETLRVPARLEGLAGPVRASLILGVIVVAFALRTWARNPDWQDDSTLANASVRTSPRSYKMHRWLAQLLFQRDPTHANIDRVIGEAERSLQLLDSLPDVRNTPGAYRLAGSYYLVKGDRLQPPGPAPEPVSGDAARAYQRALQVLLRAISIDEAGRAEYRRKAESEGAGGHATPAALASGDSEAYRLLSTVYLRMGDASRAAGAAAKARSADPLDPESYRQSAQVFLALHQADDAAVALMTGMLVTSDLGLRQALIRLYQSGLDPKGCTLVPGPNGPAINPQCETIRTHICAASVDTLKARLQTGRRDLAESQKQVFLRNYGCPAAPLDQVLADRPGS